MIEIDGTFGEGGGQVLRTSLALSMFTGQPFRIFNIRGGRRKPGLLRQHLTGVRASCAVSGGSARGAVIRSGEITFRPGTTVPGEHPFAVGTAGSTTLVLQTILLPLVLAKEPSLVSVSGGTHNGSSPSAHYLKDVYLRLLKRMGATVDLTVDRWGFYPAGGGQITAHISPTERLVPIDLTARGAIHDVEAVAVVSQLPRRIAHRELAVIRERLGLHRKAGKVIAAQDPVGPGNVVWITARCQGVIEQFSRVGENGMPADDVANRLCDEFEAWRDSGAPVGEHLADQLLLLNAICGGGRFRTTSPSQHTVTQVHVIGKFLDLPVRIDRDSEKTWIVEVGS